MIDGHFCLQVAGKPFSNLATDPILPKRSLYKNIERNDQKEQRQKKPLQYFFKSPQSQLFKVQIYALDFGGQIQYQVRTAAYIKTEYTSVYVRVVKL